MVPSTTRAAILLFTFDAEMSMTFTSHHARMHTSSAQTSSRGGVSIGGITYEQVRLIPNTWQFFCHAKWVAVLSSSLIDSLPFNSAFRFIIRLEYRFHWHCCTLVGGWILLRWFSGFFLMSTSSISLSHDRKRMSCCSDSSLSTPSPVCVFSYLNILDNRWFP